MQAIRIPSAFRRAAALSGVQLPLFQLCPDHDNLADAAHAGDKRSIELLIASGHSVVEALRGLAMRPEDFIVLMKYLPPHEIDAAVKLAHELVLWLDPLQRQCGDMLYSLCTHMEVRAIAERSLRDE